jgi:cysteinyl-tRNA synthetase
MVGGDEYVPAMIEFAEKIADKHCYELESGLYFDVASVADYGRLARAHTEEGEGRIEAVEGKRNAADFAIWRKTPLARRARWNGTRPGVAARRVGIWNAR